LTIIKPEVEGGNHTKFAQTKNMSQVKRKREKITLRPRETARISVGVGGRAGTMNQGEDQRTSRTRTGKKFSKKKSSHGKERSAKKTSSKSHGEEHKG